VTLHRRRFPWLILGCRDAEGLLRALAGNDDVNEGAEIQPEPPDQLPMFAIVRSSPATSFAYDCVALPSSIGGTCYRVQMGDPVISAIATRVGKTSAQVLLAWAVQRGTA
jgi:hypothetical protein